MLRATKAGPANLILRALPAKAYARMKLERVSLELGQVLCEPGDAASHVYFPNDSLVSLIGVAEEGKGLEVGMIGRSGMFGTSLALGAHRSPARALVQGAGTAMRMSARTFCAELKRNPRLQSEALRFAAVSMATAIQVAACNNAHQVEERCARWLLMTSDTLSTNAFFITQAFLAQMLGVRRAGVSAAAAGLQRRRLVSYRRGRMTILDRAGLVAASCACYEVIRNLAKD